MEKTVEQLQAEIDALERQKNEILLHKKNLESMGQEYLLADELHARLCMHNHTDACSWHYCRNQYDRMEWSVEHSRKDYLARALRIIGEFPHLEKSKVFRLIEIATGRAK